jgi:hypothetical protein
MENLEVFFEMRLLDTSTGALINLEVNHLTNVRNQNLFVGSLPDDDNYMSPAGMQLFINMNCGGKVFTVAKCMMPMPPAPAIAWHQHQMRSSTSTATPYIIHTDKTTFDGGIVSSSCIMQNASMPSCAWTTSIFEVTYWPYDSVGFGAIYQEYTDKYKEYGQTLYTRACCRDDVTRLAANKEMLVKQLQATDAKLGFVERELAKEEETVASTMIAMHDVIGQLQRRVA